MARVIDGREWMEQPLRNNTYKNLSPGSDKLLGATPLEGGVNFSLYSAHAEQVFLLLFDSPDTDPTDIIELKRSTETDIWHILVRDVNPGQLYGYKVTGPYDPSSGLRFNPHKLLMDPYARAMTGKFRDRDGLLYGYDRYASDGDRCSDKDLCMDIRDNTLAVPKCIVMESSFDWGDDTGPSIAPSEMIIYEAHLKGFTAHPSSGVAHPGTYLGFVEKIPYLRDLGVTSIELLPVQEFHIRDELVRKGLTEYWGYNTIGFFAPESSYAAGSSPGSQVQEFKTLVRELHRAGMEVILDVVYNHLGPEGNHLKDFGPYFTDRYRAPWGPAINFDGPQSDNVRAYFIENALYWVTEYHIDALRLDAVHAILDFSAQPFLMELGEAVHERAERLDRRIYLIPESDLNDTRIIRSQELGGYGLDAQWNDDFHHALHTLLTGEQEGYYRDFGRLGQLAKAFREGFVYSGEYSAFRRRRHGNSSHEDPASQFVVFAQNHDQVGNRMSGERLSQLVSFEALKLVASVVLLSPFIPLLFMGEEYGETAPFQYFVSHSDPTLVDATQRGRKEEFAAFKWLDEPPDPQDEGAFSRAKLNHNLRLDSHHWVLLEFYRSLISLRNEIPALAHLSKTDMEVLDYERENVLLIRRWDAACQAAAVFHFGEAAATLSLPLPAGRWHKRLDSADEHWHGPGSQAPELISSDGEVSLCMHPQAFLLFVREERS